MVDVFEAVQKRRSIRAYAPTLVPSEKLLRVLEAGRLAPSASNIQPWHFVVVVDSEKRRRLAETGVFARFLAEAPVVIVGCGDEGASPKWYVVDVAIALENMVLTATSEGLGTCWVGSFDEAKVKELLKIPENFKVVALLAVGYPKEKLDLTSKVLHFIRRRKPMKKIVSVNEYGNFKPFS